METAISIGVVEQTRNGQQAQQLQVCGASGEPRDDVLHLLPYGLSFCAPVPAAGTAPESLLVRVRPNFIVAMPAMHRPSRVRMLGPGDVAINTQWDTPDAPAEDAKHRIQLLREGDKTVIVMAADKLRLIAGGGTVVIDLDGETGLLTEKSNKHNVNTEQYAATQG